MIVVVIAGVCGGLIGHSFVGLQCTGECTTGKGIGLVVGALVASAGVAVVAVLTLRAMDEWQHIAARERKALDETQS